MAELSREDADRFLEDAKGDELEAAVAIAMSISCGEDLDGVDMHHALYLLRRVYGLPAPSWDETRVALRERGFWNERSDKGQP